MHPEDLLTFLDPSTFTQESVQIQYNQTSVPEQLLNIVVQLPSKCDPKL